MNSIKKKRIVITYYVWEPYEKLVTDEETAILNDIKEKKLLGHAGYPKVMFDEAAQ